MNIEVWGDLDAVELEATPMAMVELPSSHTSEFLKSSSAYRVLHQNQ